MTGIQSGNIPRWLSGSLFRNGPGSWKVGDDTFEHLFDCSGLLHKFCVKNGKVTYQTRFVETETFKKNRAAQRIVVTEFGTTAVADPCHSIFSRVSAIFKQETLSDNSMVSIYPMGDELFAFGETPIIHRLVFLYYYNNINKNLNLSPESTHQTSLQQPASDLPTTWES